MSNEKIVRSTSWKNLVTVKEHRDNDDNRISTGGLKPRPEESFHSNSRQCFVSALQKQTMLSSASPGTSEQSVGPQQSVNAQVSRNFFRSRSSSYCSSVDGSSCHLGHRLGTVAVEDPLTHEKVVKSKVLLLYTGGALGWKVDPQGMTYTVLRIHLSVKGLISKETMGLHRWGSKTQKREISNKLTSFKLHT